MTNRTRTYECMCLLDNREVRKGWEPLKEAVAGLFQKHEAKVLSSRRWDERRLAYPIQGQNRGTYLLIYFSGDTQSLPALRRELDFNEALLRYMIVECEQIPAEASEPEAEFDVNAIPEDDAPDEVEVEQAGPEKGEKAEGDKEPSDKESSDKESSSEESSKGESSSEGEQSSPKGEAPAETASNEGEEKN